MNHLPQLHTHKDTHTHTHKHTHTHTNTQRHTHAHTYTHTSTHTYKTRESYKRLKKKHLQNQQYCERNSHNLHPLQVNMLVCPLLDRVLSFQHFVGNFASEVESLGENKQIITRQAKNRNMHDLSTYTNICMCASILCILPILYTI